MWKGLTQRRKKKELTILPLLSSFFEPNKIIKTEIDNGTSDIKTDLYGTYQTQVSIRGALGLCGPISH